MACPFNMVSEITSHLMIWFSVLFSADSKTLKEEKREELFENLKADESIGWAVDVIDPKELSAKMLKKLVKNIWISSFLFLTVCCFYWFMYVCLFVYQQE